MRNTVYVKNNGIVSESHSVSFVENKIQDKECHLCGKCANGYPSLCSKIADVHKLEISNYGFITDGCQAFDDKGNSTAFIVEQCNNYVPSNDNSKKMKGQKLAQFKKLKHQLAAYYFDTETPEEAYLLQAELVERGHLKLNSSDLPSPKTLESLRQRIRK